MLATILLVFAYVRRRRRRREMLARWTHEEAAARAIGAKRSFHPARLEGPEAGFSMAAIGG